MAIFKVFYQENAKEIPVRENTKVVYVEASGVPEVRKFLADRNYNIEFIELLEGKYLEYEMESEDFKLEKANG